MMLNIDKLEPSGICAVYYAKYVNYVYGIIVSSVFCDKHKCLVLLSNLLSEQDIFVSG